MHFTAWNQRQYTDSAGANKLYTLVEMGAMLGLDQCKVLCEQGADALNAVEAMLRQQLVAAVGD
jgi:hypothetical protein